MFKVYAFVPTDYVSTPWLSRCFIFFYFISTEILYQNIIFIADHIALFSNWLYNYIFYRFRGFSLAASRCISFDVVYDFDEFHSLLPTAMYADANFTAFFSHCDWFLIAIFSLYPNVKINNTISWYLKIGCWIIVWCLTPFSLTLQ
jgi:hypothetical protein